MSDETRLQRELLAIEAQFAGVPASTEGGSPAAARERIIERLHAARAEPPVEAEFTSLAPWTKYLLLALSKRYGLKPYRRKGQRKMTVTLLLPEAFTREVFAPLLERMSDVLHEHLLDVVIRVTDGAFESAGGGDAVPQRLELFDE